MDTLEDLVYKAVHSKEGISIDLIKKIYNQAIDDVLNVVEWDGYTIDIKERIEQLRK